MKPHLLWAALLALSAASCEPAYADEPGNGAAVGACVSAKDWTLSVVQRSQGVSVIQLSDIGGAQAQAIVARVNAIPPETDIKADRILVLGAKSVPEDIPAPYVLVAFFDHDCLVTSGRADPREVAEILSGEAL